LIKANILNPPSIEIFLAQLGRYFECDKRNATVMSELRAGIICFLTVAYIIPVNSGILADTGGSCDPAKECLPENFEQAGAVICYVDLCYARGIETASVRLPF